MTTTLEQLQAAFADYVAGDASAQQAAEEHMAQLQADDDAKTKALTDAKAQNAQLLVTQAQDQATIKTQTDQITALQAQLAALQPKPVTLKGVSMDGTSMAEAATRQTSFGAQALRVYDGGAKGPAWLYDQLTTSGLHKTFRVVASAKYANPAAPTAAELDATAKLLALPIDFLPYHEPDQANRVPPATWKTLVTAVAKAKPAGAPSRIWLCLTGTSPARAAQWYPGAGLIDGIAFDIYPDEVKHPGTTACQAAKSYVDAVKAIDPNLRVGLGEFSTTTATTQTALATFIASMSAADFAALGLDWACYYDKDGNDALGKRITGNAALTAALKSVTLTTAS